MWVRGLKLQLAPSDTPVTSVAPYVGAWIETDYRQAGHKPWQSHPMWVRGLKHLGSAQQSRVRCRTLCGCVD